MTHVPFNSNYASKSELGQAQGKAKRATIEIAGVPVEVFQLTGNGKYAMSQKQVAKAVGRDEKRLRHFLDVVKEESLHSKGLTVGYFSGVERLKGLPDIDLTVGSLSIEGTQLQVNALSLDAVTAYWFYQAKLENRHAEALVIACMQESLERRCDAVFGVVKTEDEYEVQATLNRERWHCLFLDGCVQKQ